MRAMKDSGIEWIGEIPESWAIGKTKHYYTNHKIIAGNQSDTYERLALTLNGVIKRSKEDSTGLQPEAFNGYQVLRENELVFKLIDLENISTSRVGLSPFSGIVSPAYIILEARAGTNMKYGEYFFLSMWQRAIFNHMGDDGVRSSLNASDLLNIPYTFPTLEEQQSISAHLDRQCAHIDNIIEKTKASIEEYKKLRQAVITQAVTINGTPYKISHIGVLKNGLNYHATETKHIIKILGVGDFKDFLVLNAMEQFSDLPIEDEIANEYLLQNGDIIFVRSNGSKELVGRSIMVDNIDFPLTYSGFCIRFRNIRTDIADNKYLLYFFRSYEFREALQYQCFGTNISNLSQDMISSVKIMLPPIKKQQEIAAYLDQKCAEIDALITKKETFLTELESYKKSMIYEYVTGKKEVPQA